MIFFVPGLILCLILGQGVGLSVAMAVAWWFQRRWRDAGWVDVFWTFATRIAGVLRALWPMPEGFVPRQILIAVLTAFWSARLDLHPRHRVPRGRGRALCRVPPRPGSEVSIETVLLVADPGGGGMAVGGRRAGGGAQIPNNAPYPAVAAIVRPLGGANSMMPVTCGR
jgi:hypothetical protein